MNPKLRLYWRAPKSALEEINLLMREVNVDKITKCGRTLERVTIDLGDGERDIPVTTIEARTVGGRFTCEESTQQVKLTANWEYEDVIA